MISRQQKKGAPQGSTDAEYITNHTLCSVFIVRLHSICYGRMNRYRMGKHAEQMRRLVWIFIIRIHSKVHLIEMAQCIRFYLIVPYE